MTSADIAGYNDLFLRTATEHISAIENLLSGVSSTEKLEELFRQVHSLKGSSEVMGHNEISKTCSEIISYIRPGGDLVTINSEIVEILKKLTNQLKNQLQIFEPENLGETSA